LWAAVFSGGPTSLNSYSIESAGIGAIGLLDFMQSWNKDGAGLGSGLGSGLGLGLGPGLGSGLGLGLGFGLGSGFLVLDDSVSQP
jgi:hypothetical protein